MNARRHGYFCLVALTLLFSACKKDVVAPEQEQEALSAAVSSDATADNSAETSSPIHTSVVAQINSNVAGFWQTVPAKYNQSTKRYPLILFIHGVGELGTNLTKMNCCGFPKHAKNRTFPASFTVNGQNFSYIVMSPQFKRRPSAAEMQSVIDYAQRRFRIDPTRIYVTGLSMGGGSSWDYAAVNGQKAAAIVPVCGGTSPSSSLAKAVASKNLPVWTISSSRDRIVPISWAKNWISWIDAANPSIAPNTKVTVWSAEDHNATWARAFNPATKVDGYSIYQWMLLHKRGSASAIPNPPSQPEPPTTPNPPTTPPSTGTNQAPVANAGPDQTINYSAGIDRATLNASASQDPDGTIARYSWAKVSGPAVTILNNGLPTKTYAAHLVPGTYVFRLTVTDNKGKTDTDDVTIVVPPKGGSTGGGPTPPPSSGGNQAPVANAGPDITLNYSTAWINKATLDGTASRDADGSIVRYVWTKISGPSSRAIYNNGNPARAYSPGMAKGTHTFRLTVTDNKGATDTDDKIVYVK